MHMLLLNALHLGFQQQQFLLSTII